MPQEQLSDLDNQVFKQLTQINQIYDSPQQYSKKINFNDRKPKGLFEQKVNIQDQQIKRKLDFGNERANEQQFQQPVYYSDIDNYRINLPLQQSKKDQKELELIQKMKDLLKTR